MALKVWDSSQNKFVTLPPYPSAGAPVTASYVSWFSDFGALPNERVYGATFMAFGLESALPSPSVDGKLYFATDTGIIRRDNTVTWDVVFDVSNFIPP